MYSYYPWVVESFVDTEHFDGVYYKASNWKLIGKTKGRGFEEVHAEQMEKIIAHNFIHMIRKELDAATVLKAS